MKDASFGISAAGLKWIAMITMLVDHIGFLFVTGGAYTWFRIVGRCAFPIFCFLVAEGMVHTRCRWKYALRLLVCAIVTEPIFDMTLRGAWFDPAKQNVLWTLLLGLLAIWVADLPEYRWDTPAVSVVGQALTAVLKAGAVLVLLWAARQLHSDYDAYGVAMVLAFYFLRPQKWLSTLAVGVLSWLRGGLQVHIAVGLAPILLYNGQKGRNTRWFYLFYPGHLAVLGVLAALVK